MSDEALGKYFQFDEADLFANRNGYLTPKQQTRLAKEAKWQAQGSLIWGLIFVGAAIFPFPIMYLAGALSDFGCFGLLWVMLWGGFAFYMIRSSFSKPDLSVQKAEGPINIVKTESYNSTTHMTSDDYELHVGGHEFDVESEIADYMMQGNVYAIYYTVDPEEILSVEQLGKAKG